jgi:protein subunit release factor A
MMTHIKTGVVVKVEGRSKESNLEEARHTMVKRLKENAQSQYDSKYSTIRKDQIGDTFRGNKRRTYNEKANEVIDHISDKSTTMKDILKGNIQNLHKK